MAETRTTFVDYSWKALVLENDPNYLEAPVAYEFSEGISFKDPARDPYVNYS